VIFFHRRLRTSDRRLRSAFVNRGRFERKISEHGNRIALHLDEPLADSEERFAAAF
jgi:hypothetical protein